jgi:hypothetical protein
MNVGLVLIALGVLLLFLHSFVLTRLEQAISRRRPGSRFASEVYVAWRQQHRRASLVGAVVIILGGFFLLLG